MIYRACGPTWSRFIPKCRPAKAGLVDLAAGFNRRSTQHGPTHPFLGTALARYSLVDTVEQRPEQEGVDRGRESDEERRRHREREASAIGLQASEQAQIDVHGRRASHAAATRSKLQRAVRARLPGVGGCQGEWARAHVTAG